MFFRKPTWLIALLAALAAGGVLVWFFIGEKEPIVYTPEREVVGVSVEGREIEAFTYQPLEDMEEDNEEDTRLLFVGGVHGGYEWNSVLLAYELMDYLEENPEVIPEDIVLSIIPSANPDGVYEITQTEGRFTANTALADISDGQGRFNANDVDLNRNFDCKWEPESMWRGNVVSAGEKPFSEPEARAIRYFITKYDPDAVVFWHSQADAVYASECEDGILPETLTLMNTYADAAGYRAVESFDAYEITGDAEGWLASIGIPAVTVELSSHESLDWNQNLSGIQAVFELYSAQGSRLGE